MHGCLSREDNLFHSGRQVSSRKADLQPIRKNETHALLATNLPFEIFNQIFNYTIIKWIYS